MKEEIKTMRIRLKTKTGIRAYEIDPKRSKRYIRRGDVYYRAYKVMDSSGIARRRPISDKNSIIKLKGESFYRKYIPAQVVKTAGRETTMEQYRYLYDRKKDKWLKTAPALRKQADTSGRFQARVTITAYVDGKKERIVGYSYVMKGKSMELAKREAYENAMRQARGFATSVRGVSGSDEEPDEVKINRIQYVQWIS